MKHRPGYIIEMEKDLEQTAIQFALSGNWTDAVDVNKRLLELSENNVDAMNRLVRAYTELGKLKEAKVYVENVLKLDPFNTIALKAKDRLKSLKNGDIQYQSKSNVTSPNLFIEEPGKTKVVSLMHLGSIDTLMELDSGDELKMNCSAHRVSVVTQNGKFVGRIPDDVSARLKKLTSLKYEYRLIVKSVDKNEVKVLVREIVRPTKYHDVASFTAEKMSYVAFTPPELVHGEEDESSDAESHDSPDSEDG